MAEATRQGSNFTAADLGPLGKLDQYVYRLPALGLAVPGKVFLNQTLGLTGCEVSLNKMPAGVGMPFHHKHRLNEEVYVFVAGKGEFQVDGETFPIAEGSVVRVARDGERCWRNTGEGELVYVVIQAREGSHEGHTTQDGVGVDRPVTWPAA